MKKDILTAKRYAKSLMSTVKPDDVREIKETFEQSKELYGVLVSPIVSANEKNEIIEAVFNQTDIKLKNFLKLLIQKRRFDLFFEIIEEYNKLSDKLNNIVNVNVTSAIELTSETKEKIENIVSKNLNKTIRANYKIDESIIAGLIFQIEDDILDSSVKNKLKNIKNELIKN